MAAANQIQARHLLRRPVVVPVDTLKKHLRPRHSLQERLSTTSLSEQAALLAFIRMALKVPSGAAGKFLLPAQPQALQRVLDGGAVRFLHSQQLQVLTRKLV